MKLKGSLVRVAQLSAAQRGGMFQLMDRHFANVTPEAFLHDLAEKHWVILLADARTDELCGFSTQMLLPLDVAGCAVTGLFSGDTIVAPDHWGDPALAHVWCQLALALIDRHAPETLHWFLIAKGYRTYRFLPLFFHEFYPRHDRPTPEWAETLIGAFGRRKFGQRFNAATGVVEADAAKDRLRPGIADLTPARLQNPHIRFFAQRNPGHVNGAELCCVAPLTRANFTRAARRVTGTDAVPGRDLI